MKIAVQQYDNVHWFSAYSEYSLRVPLSRLCKKIGLGFLVDDYIKVSWLENNNAKRYYIKSRENGVKWTYTFQVLGSDQQLATLFRSEVKKLESNIDEYHVSETQKKMKESFGVDRDHLNPTILRSMKLNYEDRLKFVFLLTYGTDPQKIPGHNLQTTFAAEYKRMFISKEV